MVDEDSQHVAAQAASGAPVNRDTRRHRDVIEGEIAGRDDDAPPKAAGTSATSIKPPRPSALNGLGAFASGALGGLVVAGLAACGGWYLLAPKAYLIEQNTSRLASLEAEAQRSSATVAAESQQQVSAMAGLNNRVAALEAPDSAPTVTAIDKRVGALESANAAALPKVAAAAQAALDLTKGLKDLRADADAARGEILGFAARVTKLENGPSQASAAGPDLTALSARIDKIEASLAAPKSETRVAPEQLTANDNPAAVAIVAGALRDNLIAGKPFGAELAGLQNLGVEAAKLAALRSLVDGAPTGPTLATSFDAIAPSVLAAASPEEQDSVVARFLGHLRGLVQVRILNETSGDDPVALVSQIQAGSRRGDMSAALAAFGKLPEPARQVAADWAAAVGSKLAAEAALQSIRQAAIARLTAGAKP
jgi:hypothetical protein